MGDLSVVGAVIGACVVGAFVGACVVGAFVGADVGRAFVGTVVVGAIAGGHFQSFLDADRRHFLEIRQIRDCRKNCKGSGAVLLRL
jgi:uncharacterized protein YcfJ